MRFKRKTMFAVAAAAIAVLALPVGATANWKHGGSTLAENANITSTGQYKAQGQVGSTECQVTETTQLTAGTTTAHTKIDVDNGGAANDEAKCNVGGGLITVGCTDVEQVTYSGSWTTHAISQQTMSVTTGTVQTHLTGGALCPKTIQHTPHTEHKTTFLIFFTKTQLSGSVQSHISGQASQTLTVTGEGSITPSGTYAVA